MTLIPRSAAYSLFQSTLSVRRATTGFTAFLPLDFLISIHALREESDPLAGVKYSDDLISIHALREESDSSGFIHIVTPLLFQSTLSVRRATVSNMRL